MRLLAINKLTVNKLFAWKVINVEKITADTMYSYGDQLNVTHISEWSATHFDLKINVKVNLELNDLSLYINEEEELFWMICWRGDKKFTGCGQRVPLILGQSQNLECEILKGSFSGTFEVSVYLSVFNKKWSTLNALRPNGSIVSEKVIYRCKSLSEGSFFPIKEFSGDGKHMFYFSFCNTDDLDVSVPYSVIVYVDRNHHILKNSGENKSIRALLLLMIIQSYFQKALSDDIYPILISKSINEWSQGSLGKSFALLLNTIKNHLNMGSFNDLKQKYNTTPEIINRSVYEIFSQTMKHG